MTIYLKVFLCILVIVVIILVLIYTTRLLVKLLDKVSAESFSNNAHLTQPDNKWIDDQVRWRTGQIYDNKVTLKREKHPRMYTTDNPQDLKKRELQVIEYIKNIDPSFNTVIPIYMGDAGEFDYTIQFNRPFNSNRPILWPLRGYTDPSKIANCLEYDLMPWGKKRNGLIWRGTTTGNIIENYNRNRKSSRYKIVTAYHNSPRKDIDIGFSSIASQTKHSGGLLDKLLKPSLSIDEQLQFKYVLALEGNDVSSGFVWILASNCCPLHTYPFSFESIIHHGLKPWVHFVPINPDGSDLEEKLDWCYGHESQCKEIAEKGRSYMRNYANQKLQDEITLKILAILKTNLKVE
jgi:hypothetical protein